MCLSCTSVSAANIPGVNMEKIYPLPTRYTLEVLPDNVLCPRIEAVAVQQDGIFAVYFRANGTQSVDEPTLGEIDVPTIVQYIAVYNADGVQRFTLCYKNPNNFLDELQIAMQDNYLLIYSEERPEQVIVFDIKTQAGTMRVIEHDEEFQNYVKECFNQRTYTANGGEYRCVGGRRLAYTAGGTTSVLLQTTGSDDLVVLFLTKMRPLLCIVIALGSLLPVYLYRRKRKQKNATTSFTIEELE